MTTEPSKKPARPGRGHGKERGRLFYVLWGVGVVCMFSLPILLELVPNLAHRAVYIVPALLGNSDAQNEMAHSYDPGKFYSGNHVQQFLWHLEAAKQGDEIARKWIAFNFNDVERNPVVIHARIMETKGRQILVNELRDALEITKEVNRVRTEK